MLRQQFPQNHLFREKFRPNGNRRPARSARTEKQNGGDEQQKKESRKFSVRHQHHETRSRFSSSASNPSASSASSAAGIAPARITASLTIATPRKINVPNPPAPIAAAIVATPMVITVAVRMPARINDSARGNRTRHITCPAVIPIAVADSSIAASIPVSPTYVFRRIGNNAYNTSATTAVRFPIPPINGTGIKNPNSARLGMVWNTLATPSATLRRAGRCTIKIPSGSAIATAITMANKTNSTCSRVVERISRQWVTKNVYGLIRVSPRYCPQVPSVQFPNLGPAILRTPVLQDARASENRPAIQPPQFFRLATSQCATPATAPRANRA